ncbi:MAG: MotA/TolQ/ExbB proton channel family protein [Gemmataceae bacterium]|nr:MotA/TolQ/ExbB proton channel family protein [Gemmataceae bacterium]
MANLIAVRGQVLARLLLALLLCAVVGGVFLSTPAPVLAQEEGGGEEKRIAQNPIVHFFVSIGIVFGIIFAALSVGTVALIIVLVLDLRLSEAVPMAFVDEFTNLVNRRQFKQAYEMCKADTSFLGRVLSAGMGRLQYGIEDAREAMFQMVETVKAGKDSLISYLANVGTLGPMLGLVGTVSGMVGAFRRLGASDKAPSASDLAGEISHALVVTLVGVAVAVPAIFFYSFFKNRLAAIANHTGNLADDLLTQMYHNSKKAGGAVPTQGAGPAAAERTGTAVMEKR